MTVHPKTLTLLEQYPLTVEELNYLTREQLIAAILGEIDIVATTHHAIKMAERELVA